MRIRWLGAFVGVMLVGNMALASESRPLRPNFLNLASFQEKVAAVAQRDNSPTVPHRLLFLKPSEPVVDQTLLADLTVNGSNPASFATGDTIEIRFSFESGEMIARMTNYLDLDGDSVLTQADAQVMDRVMLVDNGPMDEDATPGAFAIRVPSLVLFPVVGNYILEVSNGISAARCYVTVEMPDTLDYSISGVVVQPPNTAGIVVVATFGDLDHGPEEGRLVAAVTDSNGAFVIPIPDYLAGDTTAVFAFDFLGVTDNYLASQPEMVAVNGNVVGINLVMMQANAWVRVRVSDQMGNPVPGVTVYLEGNGPGTQARTDSSGVALLGGMAGPGYEVDLEEDDLWPGYLASRGDSSWRSLTLVPGDTLALSRTVFATDNSIQGTVTIAGAPAAGFRVDAWSPEGFSWGYSDYTGHFSIPVYSGVGNGYWISLDWEFVPPGFVVEQPNQNVPPGATNVRIELWPAPSAIYGHVLDASTGDPIAHAWVEARSDSFVYGMGTDEDGYYRIPLMNGVYEVRAWAEGYLPVVDSVEVANDSVEVNFSLQPFSPAAIEGTVRDSLGNVLAEIHVWARADSPMYVERDAWTDSAGHYRVSDLLPGRYIVEAYGDLWARQFYDHSVSWDSAKYVFLEAGQTVSGIDFDLGPGGTISGIVVDAESGEPIARAHVRAERLVYSATSPWVYLEMWTETGPDGRYQIEGLLPGGYVVQADKMGDGYLPQLYNGHWPWEEPDTVVVSGGMYTPDIDFSLIQGCAINGWVTDTTWMPIDSALVVAEHVEDGRQYETRTDEFGNFWLAPLEPGAYRLYAVAAGYDTAWYAGPDSSNLIYLELGRWELGVNIVMGAETPTRVTQGKQQLPRAFALYRAYPNPFNPETTIRYDVPKKVHVEIAVFDALGRLVTTLVDQTVDAGQHQTVWRGIDGSGRAVGSGVYLVVMRAEGHRFVNKVLLVK